MLDQRGLGVLAAVEPPARGHRAIDQRELHGVLRLERFEEAARVSRNSVSSSPLSTRSRQKMPCDVAFFAEPRFTFRRARAGALLRVQTVGVELGGGNGTRRIGRCDHGGPPLGRVGMFDAEDLRGRRDWSGKASPKPPPAGAWDAATIRALIYRSNMRFVSKNRGFLAVALVQAGPGVGRGRRRIFLAPSPSVRRWERVGVRGRVESGCGSKAESSSVELRNAHSDSARPLTLTLSRGVPRERGPESCVGMPGGG